LKTDISKEEALSLLQQAMLEPLGLLVYASEPQPFIQALYRARRLDPSLNDLQIRQTHEGIAICHEPYQASPYEEPDVEEGEQTSNSEAEEDEGDDQTIY
jgi:hypothetical protein